MKVIVLGADGYIGWPTCMHFSRLGHDVVAVDSYVKRGWESKVGVDPLVPVPPLHARVKAWNRARRGSPVTVRDGDLTNHRFIYDVVREEQPDTIIHYAEQPSAPYSMMGRECAVETQYNNVIGTLNLIYAVLKYAPDAHVIKLGTMGEYGTPNIDIEEGWLEVQHNGRTDRMLYPKKPGSLYHLSKCHDSQNLEFACRVWGFRVTDLNQGVVYGIETDDSAPGMNTSFHYDDVFGTVINRFVVQAVAGVPLTVYGQGGQTRGFLNIRDTLRCVELAATKPPAQGEFRVFNQFTEQFSVADLARKVAKVGKDLGFDVKVDQLPNPRVEEEGHYYNAVHTGLPSLGLKPNLLTDDVLKGMMQTVIQYRDNIVPDLIQPRVKWRAKKPVLKLVAAR